MKKKPTLVTGIVILAVALIFGVFVFSPSLGKLQGIDSTVSSDPKNMTSEDVTQMDTQLDRTDRLSIQDMNIEQVLNTILNTCSSKALDSNSCTCNFQEALIEVTDIGALCRIWGFDASCCTFS